MVSENILFLINSMGIVVEDWKEKDDKPRDATWQKKENCSNS